MTTPTRHATEPHAPPLTAPAATSAGIVFRETMSGPFALGVTEPDEGAHAGQAAGTTLRMRVAIRIPHLESFLADREHAGAIGGFVDFEPLGFDMPAERGDFRLFAPGSSDTGEPAGRLMVYGLALASGDEPYYLHGHKLVMGGTPWRIWSETSTLFATLHRGHGPEGPIVGAGVLRLGALSFARILPSLRAHGAPSVRAGASTLLRFGRFFGGELWNAYVRGRPPA